MNTQIKLIVIVALCLFTGATKVVAQGDSKSAIGLKANTEIKPLKVGDKVPNLYLGEVLNHPTLKEAHVDDFKGKLLILDFWDTGCSVCIGLWPKLPALQAEFKKDMVLLPIGFDGKNKGTIKKFLAKRKGAEYDLKIPSSVVDSLEVLRKYFPGQGFPRVVWISPSGDFLGKTDGKALTSNNIKRLLNGEKLNLKPSNWAKRSINATLDSQSIDFIPRHKPSFLDIGSRFMGYIDTAIITSLYINSRPDFIRFTAVNSSIYGLYTNAYKMFTGDETLYNDILSTRIKRIVIEKGRKPFYIITSAGKKFDNWEMEDYYKNNVFCYDLLLQPTHDQKSGAKMVIQDLDRYLGIESSIQKRKTKCLTLKRTSNIDKLKAKSDLPDFTDPAVTNEKRLSSASMNSVLEQLNRVFTPLLILDETGYPYKVDMDIDLKKFYSLPELRSTLKKYDLDLVEVERELPMLVLKDVRK